MTSDWSPVAETERISSVDVVRGAALLGIALMNIVVTGLPLAADFNPKVSGGASGANLAAYFLQFVLFDGKMRGLFSMMFGASTWLLVERLERRGAGTRAAEIYYRRLLWLMLFGVVHAYLIWHGDILYPYALLGLILLPLLRVRPRNLLTVAGILVLVMTGQTVYQGLHLREGHRAAMETKGSPLSDKENAAKADWEEARETVNPKPDDLRKERAMYSGSYFEVVAKRVEVVQENHSTPFYFGGLDMLSMMLVGIAFIKSGVLSGERSTGFYWRMLTVGFGIGLPIGIFAAWKSWQQGFEPSLSMFTYWTFPLGRAAMTLGHMAALLLVCKYGIWKALQGRLAAVGRMAFSNYIAHSVIYGLVFYGYGFNLFDKLQRYQLYYVVLGMWTFSLLWSPLWLRYFRFGPLEWGWRSLTYWKRQPMRVRKGLRT